MHSIVEFCEKELGVKLFPGQAAALSQYYESGCPHWLLLAGRRGGKSLLSDCIAVYESVVPDFTGLIREGETRFILILSTRIENSSLHIKNIGKLLRHNKRLAKLIVRETVDSLTLSNGVEILSLPASARTARGFTASLCVLDELAFYVDSKGNASADSVYTAIEPTISTFGERGRLVITTSVNSRSGIVYDLFERSQSGELLDYWVTKADSRSLNPKVSERAIKSALARDEESARAEYFAEFREPVESFLSSEAIEQCIDPARQETVKAKPGVSYCMGIDPAVTQDRYGFVICHREGDLFFLDYAHILKPPINPQSAEDLLFSLNERFHPRVIRVDNPGTFERLKGKLSSLKYDPFTRRLKLEIYSSLKERINLGQLVLYPHKDLLEELRSLQVRGGVDIGHPRSGSCTHDDLSDCLALAVEALASGLYTSNNIGWIPDLWECEWTDNPQGDEVALAHNEIIAQYEFEAEQPFGSRWHIRTEHKPGVTSENCKARSGYCLACKHELQASGFYEQQENDFRLQPGYTSAGQEYQELRELRARQVDEERQAENDVIRKFWKRVRSN